jgi:hypothetical protein
VLIYKDILIGKALFHVIYSGVVDKYYP